MASTIDGRRQPADDRRTADDASARRRRRPDDEPVTLRRRVRTGLTALVVGPVLGGLVYLIDAAVGGDRLTAEHLWTGVVAVAIVAVLGFLFPRFSTPSGSMMGDAVRKLDFAGASTGKKVLYVVLILGFVALMAFRAYHRMVD